MRITRLPKIRKHRVFRDFTWPSELLAFVRFNVIYGWNGSGKTALSVLFEHIQNREAIEDSEVEFELDNGQKILGSDLPDSSVLSVRVFNRNFVSRTITAIDTGNVNPIYFFGHESIEQQKRVETLKEQLVEAHKTIGKAEGAANKAKKDLDAYNIEKAKMIKEMLLGSAEYATYNKRDFDDAASSIRGLSAPPKALSDDQKKDLRKKKEQHAKPSISSVSIAIPDIEKSRSRTSEILETSITSQLINDLVNDPEVGRWVEKGLPLHKGDRETDICRFCGNELSHVRREKLEAHFNDTVKSFRQDLNQAILDIKNQQQTLEKITFPDKSRFYDHLADKAYQNMEKAKQYIQSLRDTFDIFENALNKRKDNIFEPVLLEANDVSEVLSSDSLSEIISTVNSIIEEHETTTKNLDEEKRDACRKLEQDYVLDALPKFRLLTSDLQTAEAAHSKNRAIPKKLKEEISDIENKIVQYRRPAEELNRELSSYLGHDELKFEVKETGYALMRRGYPAQHLSEGERTAISFLYFLKSLEDKDFDMRQGIVVIDDPVSSLDSNALFSAFGYMKERTKNCHQLFILTHNFSFFRQVRDWFRHTNEDRYYYLAISVIDNERRTSLSRMDSLLEKYQSEYHFLFKNVHDVAKGEVDSTTELAQFYGVPNIARRVMETFLAYRFPDREGGLRGKLDHVDFNSEKKVRILRLLHTYSHSEGINDSEHDPSLLAETRSVMKDILDLIEASDPKHYQGMINLVQGTDPKD